LGFAFFVDGTGLEQIKFRLSPDISGKYGAIVTAEARFFRQEDQTLMAMADIYESLHNVSHSLQSYSTFPSEIP
jgi:hypothetical protein